ncbi:MAG TPA: hypothetical protein PK006_03700 [Saprospiraceae bacterium]|nr:hypothetical protein [Saprospiraceae bacterium]
MQTYREYNSEQEAFSAAKLLDKHSIPYQIEKSPAFFDIASFSNQTSIFYILKADKQNFPIIKEILKDEPEIALSDMDPGYYLFSFSNDELMEIIDKKDEWGELDYSLAKKLLSQRGIPLSDKVIEEKNKLRLEQLKSFEPTPYIYIIIGFILSIFGGLLGVYIGYKLSSSKKIITGEGEYYIFSPEVRRIGRFMMIMGGIAFSITLIIVLWRSYITNLQ